VAQVVIFDLVGGGKGFIVVKNDSPLEEEV